MKKRLFLIHTINKFMDIIYNPFAKPFINENPDVEIFNICDDSLLTDTLKAGKMPNTVASRILNYLGIHFTHVPTIYCVYCFMSFTMVLYVIGSTITAFCISL